MDDTVFDRMAASLARRAAIDSEIHELTRERDELEESIRSMARELVGGGHQERHTTTIAPATTFPRRFMRLLEHMTVGVDVDAGTLALRAFGESNETTRKNVSSDLSRMKSDGLVDAVSRGVFRITQKGKVAYDNRGED